MATKAITKSSELSLNVGNEVVTPKGVIFRVNLWQTAKQHGLNTENSAYGSRMQVTMQDGTKREFFSSSYKGSETLTKFYAETGLETSGKSGERGPKKPFGQKLEELYSDSKEPDKLQTLLNFLLSTKECPKWLQNAFEAEQKRLKEEEERKRKEEERATAIKVLMSQGFTKREAENLLDSKKQKK